MTPAAQAVELLIHEYGKLVFHSIYAMTGDWEESQDLTQDTFHQALRAIDAARETSGGHFHAKAWLLRIALNTVRMQRRRRNLLRFIPFSHMGNGTRQDASDGENQPIFEQALPVQPGGFSSTEVHDPAELIAEQDVVHRTIARLPETLRVCLLLSVVGGLSNTEIANLLTMTEPAVRQRLARARKQFQQMYIAEGGEELFERSQAGVPHKHQDTQPDSEQGSEQRPLKDRSQRLKLANQPPTTWSSYA
jgi:RNA polymerase sigma-70 factor (ECF subfamily)